MMDRSSKWTNVYLTLSTELDSAEKKKVKSRNNRNKKIIFLLVLVLNLLLLGVVKYTNFILDNLNKVWNALTGVSTQAITVDFLIPLGISYYTFQSIGYLFDVYRSKYDAETNFAKYLLFVTYFPKILQGPIERFDHLGPQLFVGNKFDVQNLKHGAILMLWGYMKKMVIANNIAPFVLEICKNYEKYDGSLIVLAVFSYCFQLYADFSGGIDMISGASEMFGIKLVDNFKRPYFATSLGDFWRRWHISLGSWMKDYVFYPFAMSPKIMKISRKIKSGNKNLAKVFPAAVGNIVVFLIVGLWHGAEWRFIIWGLYNGMILGLSALMEPMYAQFHSRFPKWKENPIWHGFQVIRTFLIVYIGNYFDCCQEVRGAFEMLRQSIFNFNLSNLSLDTIQNLGVSNRAIFALAAALPMLLVVSIAQERGTEVRTWLDRRNPVLRWTILYGLIFFTIAFAATGFNALEGFMYEVF